MRSRIPVNTCKSEYTVKITGIFIVMRIMKTIKKAQRVSVIFPEHRPTRDVESTFLNSTQNSSFLIPSYADCLLG